ncbi:MAG: TIGR02281 family clan AA aspartic protease [Hyphomicrobium sp.]
MLGWLLTVLTALVVLFWYLGGGGSGAEVAEDTGRIIYAAALGLFALFLAVSIAGDYRGRWGRALQHAAIWVCLGIGLIGAYAYRDAIPVMTARIVGEVMPPGQPISAEAAGTGERAVRLRKRPDGHFVARAEVQGTTLGFLVDTGASTVVLKPADAEKAGVDVGALAYTVAVQTANGTAYAAAVRLRSVTIGPIEVNDVEALVTKPGSLKENLLGMSFLKRLRSYEVSGDFLTLRG